ncbi:N-acetylmuramoyl-L-alanine amidase [Aureimonas endophytica]|uniref:N-acetylmuramoyl-L-alanine amidase n=1 Tax=Aureimonas endophytica TaxID=2027858 RepID=A0A916ZEN7_9HYPH|nr:N-acetylmuramoyl-L-alanine amidase [Aureimonas endophytica]GGD92436.1 N-acetylmuramoyl-L-alanine amidase [Aureimonas endophytica]
MTPDTALVDAILPSPNVNERRAAPDILLLHYTGMEDGEAAARWLASERSQVSCHYLIHEDGRIVQLVPEAQRAWHAGAGRWQGRGDINSRSIGIEIVNPGHEFGYRPFPDIQIARVIALCADILARWPIAPRNVLAHSDTAPSRKEDPGELFPWSQLHAAGIGHLVAPESIAGGRFLSAGDEGSPVAAYQQLLALYGYDVAATGRFDAATRFATIAFQRHFRQARVDGVADVSTVATLHRLLSALPAPEEG